MFDPDLAEAIALAFVDREGDDKTVALRRQLGHRRQHAEIGIALGQIELAQQLAVIGHPIGVVAVVGRQEAIPAAFLGRDHAAQLAFAESLVADEIDAADAGKLALVDLEDEIDAVLRKLDDLGLDRRPKPAVPAVEVENPL